MPETTKKQPARIEHPGQTRTNRIVKIALLSALGAVLMYFEFPVPFFPVFLNLDFSDIPAVIGGFAFGPLAGVMVALVKNILHLIIKGSDSGGVGTLANFIVCSAMVIPSALIYKKHKTKKVALIGLAVGTLTMAVVGGLVNYFILLPFYANFMPVDKIIQMGAMVNPYITSMKTLVLYAIIPFNLFKGIIISVVTLLIYKHISKFLHK